jgi:putative copper export protein/cytochrome c oxidase assembly factor CtaG
VTVAIGASWLAGSLIEKVLPGLASAPVSVQILIPIARVTADLLAVTVVGALLVAGFLVTAPGERLTPAGNAGCRAAAALSVGWLLATVVTAALTLSDVFALPLADVFDPSIMMSFLTQTTLGLVFLLQLVGAALVALLAPLSTRRWHVGALLVLALATIGVRGASGHATIAGEHESAGLLLGVHVAAASVWVGGLIVLVAVLLGRATPDPEAFRVFSGIALWSVTVVAVTGVAQALLRVADISELFGSAYGLLLITKAELLAVLIAVGWLQRARTLPLLEAGSRRPMAILAGVEAAIMAAVVGLSVTLSRTPMATQGSANAHPSHGQVMPPVPIGLMHLLMQWRIDAVVLVLAAVLVGGYVVGVSEARRRGETWPGSRSACYFAGVVSLVLAGCSGIGSYSLVLMGATLVHSVVLLLVVPTLLVLGRPFALMEMAGGRDAPTPALKLVGRLRYVAVTKASRNPGVPVIVAVSVVVALYCTPLLPNILWPFWGRTAMDLVLLAVGTWSCAVVIHNAEGGGRRSLWPAMAMAGALLGLLAAVIWIPYVLAGDYFGYFLPPYAEDLIASQRIGALVSMAIVLAWLAAVTIAGRDGGGDPHRTGQRRLSRAR